MKVCWRAAILFFFLTGLVLVGSLGTSSSLTFLWPAYAALGFAAILSVGLIHEKVAFSLPRWSTLAVLALVGWVLVRASSSPVAYFAREDAALIVACFLVYALFLHFFNSSAWRKRFVDGLALLVLLNLGFALLQLFFGTSLWILPGYQRTVSDQAGGLFNHPDHFSGFLAMLVPLWLAVASFGRRTWTFRLGMLALALISIIVVLLSGRTLGIFTLLAGIAASAILSTVVLYHRTDPETRRSVLRAIALSAVLISILLAASSKPLVRVVDHTLLSKGGNLVLPEIWKSGWRQAMQSPLTGTGSRSTYFYDRLFRTPAMGTAAAEPEFTHNEFLQAFADYGLIGLALILMVLGLHFAEGFRFVREYARFSPGGGQRAPRSDHLALSIGSLAILCALATLASFDFVLRLPVMAVTAAGLLAALAAPDPMAHATRPETTRFLLPGGVLQFSQRALACGMGMAITILGIRFSQSEYHYEMARRCFTENPTGFEHFRHLKTARSIDPKNPFIFSLSAHAQVAAIRTDMTLAERRQALDQANLYFEQVERLYPQDIFAAIGHAAVLDELERPSEALLRLRAARESAPLYGNLMLAEAEHYLRCGRIAEAERSYTEALNAPAFRDVAAAQRGLMTVTEWKLIAERSGIDWKVAPDALETEPLLAGEAAAYRRPSEAKVTQKVTAGKTTPEVEKVEPKKDKKLDTPKDIDLPEVSEVRE